MNNWKKGLKAKIRFNINGSISLEQLTNIKSLTLLEEEEDRLKELLKGIRKTLKRSRRGYERTNDSELLEIKIALIGEAADDLVNKQDEDALKIKEEEGRKTLVQGILKEKERRQIEALKNLSDKELDVLIK